MFTLGIQSETRACLTCVGLTIIIDCHHQPQEETSTGNSIEASRRGGEEYREVYRGACRECRLLHARSDVIYQREKSNGHGCYWEYISLEHVFFTRLVRVSTASWTPEIFVERPPVAESRRPLSPCGSNATWVCNGTPANRDQS
jgi:hypothetical protein